MNEIEHKLISIFSEILDLEIEEINEDFYAETIDLWDSRNYILLIQKIWR